MAVPAMRGAARRGILRSTCDLELEYQGTRKFHEGFRAAPFLLGELGELFVNRMHFDVYLCPRCGRVEFFLDGVGEEFRPH